MNHRKRGWLIGGGVVLAASWPIDLAWAEFPLGCHPWKSPPAVMPAPAGSYVRQWQALQTAKARADQFVIYGHEWYMGGTTLGPYGQAHLQEISRRLPEVPVPVIVQPDLNGDVNEIRRKVIIDFLSKTGSTDAAVRVQIAFPQAEGMTGEEAERVYRRMLQNTYRGGSRSGGASGGLPGGILGGGASIIGGSRY